MKYTKVIVCGGRMIEISADTKVEIRNATNDERELFKQKYWNWPDKPHCQESLWKALCTAFNSLEDSFFGSSRYKILSRSLKRLGHYDKEDGTLKECRFTFLKNDTDSDCKIQIDATYSHSVEIEQTDEWGFQKLDSSGNPLPPKTHRYNTKETTLCKYPQDFSVLLDVAEQYLSEKMDGKKLSDITDPICLFTLVQNYQKKWKKKKNRLIILNLINSNLFDIRKFNKYIYDFNKILESNSFKQFGKSDQRVLDVDGDIFFEFENNCGFDIDDKVTELQTIISKVSESNNPGERQVNYAIEWFKDTYNGYMVSVKNDCENLYRYNCILLTKPDFRDEVQEYDHIIVCSAGIVLIETKHWKGTVEIRSDGKWVRKAEVDSPVLGVDSPKFQMRRHEVLMQKILPTIPVYSMLCFSNSATIINGRENFKDYPIITVEQLEEVLTNLCAKGVYSKEDIDRMVTTIEAHKVKKA